MLHETKEIAILTLIDSYHCDSYMASAALYRSFYKCQDKYKKPYIYLCSTFRIGYVLDKILNLHNNISEIHFAGSGYAAVNDNLREAFQRLETTKCQFIWYIAFADADRVADEYKEFSNVKIIKSKQNDGCLEKMFWDQIINKEVLKKDPVFKKILLYNEGKRQKWESDISKIEEYPLIIQWAKCCTDNYFWDAYNTHHLINFIKKTAHNGEPDGSDKKHIKNYILNLSEEFTAHSESSIDVKNKIKILADKDVNIIISGESGTGKELLIKDMIKNSRRFGYSIYNCASFPNDSLAESALFGHKKGSFTGGIYDRDGIFKNAAGGTIVLDEIQELSLSLQARLLRTLESWTILPVGSDYEIEIKPCRVIGLTNSNIKEMVTQGKFRRDLWYRIADVVIEIPPLRKRKEDIPFILNKIIINEAKRFNVEPMKVAQKVVKWLSTLTWYGNGREIRNAVRKAYALEDNSFSWLKVEKISFPVKDETPVFKCYEPISLENLVTAYCHKVFSYCDNNKQNTRRKLKVSLNTVIKYLEKYEKDVENSEEYLDELR